MTAYISKRIYFFGLRIKKDWNQNRQVKRTLFIEFLFIIEDRYNCSDFEINTNRKQAILFVHFLTISKIVCFKICMRVECSCK